MATLADKVFRFQQAPQVKIALNFSLAKQMKVLPDELPAVADAKPTHQLAQTAQLLVQPGTGQTVVRSLSGKTPLTAVESKDGWTLLAREGQVLGYVATRDLAPMQ